MDKKIRIRKWDWPEKTIMWSILLIGVANVAIGLALLLSS